MRARLALPAVEVDQVLHRALAERRLADDQAAAVVLDGGSEDLGGRRGRTVDQHCQGAIPRHARVVVGFDGHAPAGILDLHHGAPVDEQPGEFHCLHQRAAAILAQVHHHAVDLFRLQFGEQARGVGGGRARIGIAALGGLEVEVEARQRDHADLLAADVDDRLAGRLFLELDLVAHDRDQLVLAVHAGVGGQDVQPHPGALVAADQVHDIVDAPADHVGQRALVALPDRNHAVAHLHLAGGHGGAAGNQRADHDVFVLPLQHRADALERQPHLHVEVFRAARTHVAGVRVDRGGIRIHEALEHIVAAQFVHARIEVGVALVQGLADLLRRAAGELEPQLVVLDVLAPDLFKRRAVRGPGRLLAVIGPAVLGREVHRLGQLRPRERRAIVDALDVGRVDVERGPQVLRLDRIVQLRAVGREAIHVRLGEEQLVAVERLQVAAEDFRRQRIVQHARPVGVLAVREQAIDQARCHRLGLRRGHRAGGLGGRRGRARGGQRQGQGQERGEGQELAAEHDRIPWKTAGAACGQLAPRGDHGRVPMVLGGCLRRWLGRSLLQPPFGPRDRTTGPSAQTPRG